MPNSSQPVRFRSKQVKCKTLQSDTDSCCVLSQSLDFLYCNPAWDAFARSNGGAEAALGRNVVGCNLLEFLPGVLRPFLADHLSKALGDLRIWDHFYECSSPHEFRIFRLQALPLPDAGEILICHSLMHVGPHFRAPSRCPSGAGPVRTCCHCRKTAKPGEPQTWLWAPEHVARPPMGCVSDLCPECAEYYEAGRAPWPENVWKPPAWAGRQSDAAD